LIRIGPKEFNSTVACLGTQLIDIVSRVDSIVGNLCWYCADVAAHMALPDCFTFQSYPKLIGTSDELKHALRDIDQFESGVFFATENCEQFVVCESVEFFTHSKQEFREIGNACLEIRAFDYSYFEVYIRSRDLADSLSLYFHTPILFRHDA
jgi:hypothetical protein